MNPSEMSTSVVISALEDSLAKESISEGCRDILCNRLKQNKAKLPKSKRPPPKSAAINNSNSRKKAAEKRHRACSLCIARSAMDVAKRKKKADPPRFLGDI